MTKTTLFSTPLNTVIHHLRRLAAFFLSWKEAVSLDNQSLDIKNPQIWVRGTLLSANLCSQKTVYHNNKQVANRKSFQTICLFFLLEEPAPNTTAAGHVPLGSTKLLCISGLERSPALCESPELEL